MGKPFKNVIYYTKPLLPDLNLLDKGLREIYSKAWLTNMGNQHKRLEKLVQRRLKSKYISLFNNGMTALMVAIKALDLRGEIITTPFTFPATPNAILWNNLEPVFCDIDKDSLNINPVEIEKRITKKTSAILAVHVFGNPCNVNEIEQIAKKHKLKVIYDAAHAYGLKYKNKSIANFGDISMFSFHATKLFHSLEGGCLAFNEKKLSRKVYLYKNFGIAGEEEVLLPGLNGKLNEVNCLFGILVDKMIQDEKKARKRIYKIYKENLKDIDGIFFYDKDNPNIQDSYQYFVIRINQKLYGKNRDQLFKKLRAYNVFARKYFSPLCSNLPYFKSNLSAKKKNLKIANQIVNETLALPFYGSLKDWEVLKICKIIKNFKK
ncbi:MAG: DegT/DnrJ/EryC1/StrS family aminotransferase [Candidatus Moranbacteria bacterium]|nr:DegT/DnrJ/EryC1/StrS family aminotransferase [Candidatus Moranbacteria bacterium]